MEAGTHIHIEKHAHMNENTYARAHTRRYIQSTYIQIIKIYTYCHWNEISSTYFPAPQKGHKCKTRSIPLERVLSTSTSKEANNWFKGNGEAFFTSEADNFLLLLMLY